MAAECSSPCKYAREAPKSTYEGQKVRKSHEFVERLRNARDLRATDKARARRIFGNPVKRETDFGPDFRSEPRGRHAGLPHRLGRTISRSHDFSCRLCEPSRVLGHPPDCRPCTPMAAYAQGGHRQCSHSMPTAMKCVNDCRQNRSRYVPACCCEDAWRRMKIARQERAAFLRERNVL